MIFIYTLVVGFPGTFPLLERKYLFNLISDSDEPGKKINSEQSLFYCGAIKWGI